MSMTVKVNIEASIATIVLARPDKLNALNGPMIAELGDAAVLIGKDASVRVAIITGSGKAFCTGGDIAAWSEIGSLSLGEEWVREGHRVFDALARLRVPLIAALNGSAFGGGLELAATADLRIAEAGAKFGLPETGLGMVPGWSGTQRLVRRFGSRVVRRLALGGEIVTSAAALALGLVDEVVPAGGSLAAAQVWADRISQRGPTATLVAKRLINAAEGEDKEATLEILASAFVATTDELKEGVASFREKRRPQFTNPALDPA